MKFRVGERVRVRRELYVGYKYYMKDSDLYEVLSERMRNNLGELATVMEIENGRYKLDIDKFHYYTDEMLMKFVDDKARNDEISQDVEDFLNHMLRLVPEQLINHALDVSDEELFKKVTEKYYKSVDNRL